jgi:hypothetical protein
MEAVVERVRVRWDIPNGTVEGALLGWTDGTPWGPEGLFWDGNSGWIVAQDGDPIPERVPSDERIVPVTIPAGTRVKVEHGATYLGTVMAGPDSTGSNWLIDWDEPMDGDSSPSWEAIDVESIMLPESL